jgi:leader peptidase (prepilin peptidase)/N-methyltransferase
LEILSAFILFLVGISFGSFLNVVADRVPQRKSIVSPPSHCFQCGHPLESRDLVPVLSYIILRGKCRYCGAAIPLRSMLVELITGLLFVLAWAVLGPQWQLPIVLLYMCILIVLSITDLEGGIIPGIIIYPAVGITLIITAVKILTGLSPDIISASIGLASGFGLFFLIWCIARLFKKEVIGFGDVVMGGLIGIMVGFPLVMAAIYLAVLTGGLMAIVLVILGLRKFTEPVPFALFLALGTVVALLWGGEITVLISLLVP